MKLALAALLMMTAVARAENNGDLSKNTEIQALTQQVAAKFGLQAKTPTFAGGAMSSIDFSLKLAKPYSVTIGGTSLKNDVAWPIVIDNETESETKVLLQQILKLPKSAITNMAKAYVQFDIDLNDLDWKDSISAYTPNALPVDMRNSVKGELMWVTVPYITNPRLINGKIRTSGGSSGQVGEITVPTSNLAVVLKYPGVPVYKKGDLKKAILANEETRAKLVETIYKNIENFAADRTNTYGMRFEELQGKDVKDGKDYKYTLIDWATIVKQFER
jgi:hypothetical protein